MYALSYPAVCVSLMLGYQCAELEKADPSGLIQGWRFIRWEKQQNKGVGNLGFSGQKVVEVMDHGVWAREGKDEAGKNWCTVKDWDDREHSTWWRACEDKEQVPQRRAGKQVGKDREVWSENAYTKICFPKHYFHIVLGNLKVRYKWKDKCLVNYLLFCFMCLWLSSTW